MDKNETRLTVRVQPNSRKNEVIGFREDILYLKISAPPVEGKANREMVNYLSDILGIARSRIIVEKGTAGRRKLVGISGMNREQIVEKVLSLKGADGR
jgi:uncharacterized protein (TIGR00251 family)